VRGLLREALASAWSAPVTSVATIVMVAGLCATVLLTTGRTVGAEQTVLSSIDLVGTRAIVVRSDSTAGVDTDVLDRLKEVEGIQWVACFGPAVDATNTALGDATKVPARFAYGGDLAELAIPVTTIVPGLTAYASPSALEQLGMRDGVGAITTSEGLDVTVAGELSVPDWLRFLEPVVLIPQPHEAPPRQVAVLVVIAERPDLVSPVSRAVQSVLAVDDPAKVTITTSEALAQLRALVEGQLGSFGRGLALLILAVSGALVAAILTGLVALRRRDFGRRRTLGATRGLIFMLLVTQTLALAVIGVVAGSVLASSILIATGDPLPGAAFTTAVGILAIVVSLVAASIPAALAARRDPLQELRVP